MSIKKAKVGFVALVFAASSLVAFNSATSANAAPTGQWCKGVKIAAFPGGPQGGVFANNVYNGYRQAQRDLGPMGPRARSSVKWCDDCAQLS